MLHEAKLGFVKISAVTSVFANEYPALAGFIIFVLCFYFIGNIIIDGICVYRDTCLALRQMRQPMTMDVAAKPIAAK